MKATRYDIRNNHTEACVFEEWKSAERKMGYCGKPAVNLRSGISARNHVVKSTLNMLPTPINAKNRKNDRS